MKDDQKNTGISAALNRIIEKPESSQELIEYALKKMMDIEYDEKIKEFNAALAATQAEMPKIFKNRYNNQTRSNYVDLATINETAQPIYTSHGLATSFSTFTSEISGCLGLRCELTHSGGYMKCYNVNIPIDNAGLKGTLNKTAIHAFGSTITYGQRYLICLIFNIAAFDDNDGNLTDPPELVTNQQVENLKTVISETNTNMTRLLNSINCSSLAEVRADKFDDLVKLIRDTAVKRQQKEQMDKEA